MSPSSPIRKNNAIEEVTIGVFLKQPLADKQFIKHFMNRQDEIGALLPEYAIIGSFGSDENSSVPTVIAQNQPGIIRFKPSAKLQGRREWSLCVQPDSIVVACGEYQSWNTESAQALAILNYALAKTGASTNAISAAIFQCVDAFSGPDQKNSAGDIFREGSSFFAQHIFNESNLAWHIYQGWHTENLSLKYVHNLNIKLGKTNNGDSLGSKTVITHTVNIRAKSQPELTDSRSLVEGQFPDGCLDQVFGDARSLNRSLVKDLLNENMLGKIGIID